MKFMQCLIATSLIIGIFRSDVVMCLDVVQCIIGHKPWGSSYFSKICGLASLYSSYILGFRLATNLDTVWPMGNYIFFVY